MATMRHLPRVLSLLHHGVLLVLLTGLTVHAAAAEPGWRAVPFQSAEQRAAGIPGGEGGQWHRAIAVSTNGRFLLYGTDVGGLWRSRDAGTTWEPCNVGFDPRGTSGLAIDPGNPQRCLAVGANSMASPRHGLWLSEDGAASWRQVLSATICGAMDFRRQLAFDPTTWDAAQARTGRVYWSRIATDAPGPGRTEAIPSDPALWRSDDGGRTWQVLPGTAHLAGGEIAVAPAGGLLYATHPTGLWLSRDGGTNFTRILDGPCTAVDVHPRLPTSVWATTPEAALRSDDAGATWTILFTASSLPGKGSVRDVRVSPVDDRRLAFWRQGDYQADDYEWPRFVSHDGGRSVLPASVDGRTSFLPTNARQHAPTWSPIDGQVCWSSGGDFPTISRDGGRTFVPSSGGFNCILVGGKLTFNVRDADLLMIGSQDYNGAVTRDGGRTWTYAPVSGHRWGGFTYGGYAIDAQVMIVGVQDSWSAPPILNVSRDGGATWSSTGLAYEGVKVATGDPREPSVAFAGSLRTADRGMTWQRMTGCSGVLAHDAAGNLYGRGPEGVVMSGDHGVSWRLLAPITGTIEDLAVTPAGDQVWVVVDQRDLRRWSAGGWTRVTNLVPDQEPSVPRVNSVAIDPTDPQVVYVGRCRNRYTSSVSVQRSTDGGATWASLSLTQPLTDRQRDGGREAFCLRVHPQTRDLWVAGGCFGLWIHPAPSASPGNTP
jgi:hypothetical protein